MDIYHVNDKGVTGRCTATKRSCPLGGDERHFTTPEAATKFYEASMSNKNLTARKRAVVDPILKNWPKVPDSNGQSFNTTWNNEFKALREFEAIHGPVDQAHEINPMELLDKPIWFSREKGASFISTNDFYRLDIDYDEDIPYDGVVTVTAKIGGGNRDDYEDEWSDAENHPTFITVDEYDVYAEFYFGVNKDQSEIDSYNQRAKEFNTVKFLNITRKSVENSEMTPWGATFAGAGTLDRQRIVRVASQRNNIKAISDELPKLEASFQKEQEFNDRLTTGDISEDEIEAMTFRYPYEKAQALNAVKQLRKSRIELKAIEDAKAVALSLPEDDPLRKWAIGDRGTASYQVEEKQGRKKVKVTKTYERGNLLDEEMKNPTHGVNNALGDMKRSFYQFNEDFKRKEKIIADKKERLNSWLEDREAAWAAGWPGAIEDLPPMDKKFNAI